MRNFLGLLLLPIAAFASEPEQTTPTHFGQLSCKEWYAASKALTALPDRVPLAAVNSWLYGYVAGLRGISTMDPEVYVRFQMDVMDNCVANLSATLLEVAKSVPFRSTGDY
jgi:hypothetical protein